MVQVKLALFATIAAFAWPGSWILMVDADVIMFQDPFAAIVGHGHSLATNVAAVRSQHIDKWWTVVDLDAISVNGKNVLQTHSVEERTVKLQPDNRLVNIGIDVEKFRSLR